MPPPRHPVIEKMDRTGKLQGDLLPGIDQSFRTGLADPDLAAADLDRIERIGAHEGNGGNRALAGLIGADLDVFRTNGNLDVAGGNPV